MISALADQNGLKLGNYVYRGKGADFENFDFQPFLGTFQVQILAPGAKNGLFLDLTSAKRHIQERALRLVYEDYATPFEQLLTENKSLTMHQKNIQRVAILMFKVKNNLCPSFIQEIFQLNEKVHNTRSNSQFLRPKVATVSWGDLSLSGHLDQQYGIRWSQMN